MTKPAKGKAKVKVTTDTYSYMGLYAGAVVEIDEVYTQDGQITEVGFTLNGKYWALDKNQFEIVPMTPATKDMVNSPSHYALFDDIEAIQVIASSMTKEMFKGYCFGNLLKYKLRAGGKDDTQQELKKAERYKGLYEEYQHLCKQN